MASSNRVPNRRRRKNGFDGSTKEQIISCTCYALMTTFFLALYGSTVIPDRFAPAMQESNSTTASSDILIPQKISRETFRLHTSLLLGGYGALLLTVVGLWLALELIDPATEGGCPYPCFKEAQAQVRWDAVTRKRVRGLDHYCKFLNTPVGARNYVLFFALVLVGLLQFLYQMVAGVIILILWVPWRPDQAWRVGLWLAQSLLALLCTIPFWTLLCFHIYLMGRGMSTYDYLLEEAKKAREQKRAKRHHSRNATHPDPLLPSQTQPQSTSEAS